MAASTVWISYDLGVRGDYEGLYAWLDAHGAKECGDSLAVLTYGHERSLIGELMADLQEHVTTGKRTRIYVIYRDRASGKNKGSFVLGGRRAAAWTGYAASELTTMDEDEEA
jgi:hypothetical protein